MFHLRIVLLFLPLLPWSRCRTAQTASYLVIPNGYKSNFAPLSQEDEEPFTLKVDLEVWAITDVSLQKQDIQVDMRVSIEWLDYRLQVKPNITANRTWLLLNKADVKRVWKPTFLFRNCKGCDPLSFAVRPNTELYVDKNTAAFFARHRVLNRFTCAINLRAYPMDIQTCPVQLYIYEETYDAMRLNHTYLDQPARILSNLTLSEFFVEPMIKGDCTFVEDEEVYACLDLTIRLDHLVTYHLMTSYAPTSFIVILSWISFWLPIDMAPARVALGLTSLLTLATRLDQAQKDLPPVAYIKAIDVWMFACIFLVSTSLCEFAVSHYRWRLKKLSEPKPQPKTGVKPVSKPKFPAPRHISTYNTVIQVRPYVVKKEFVAPPPPPPPPDPAPTVNQKDGTPMDRMSRILFPLAFLFFNIVYWSHYTTYYHN